MKSVRETNLKNSNLYLAEVPTDHEDEPVKLIGKIQSPAGEIKIFKDGDEATIMRPSGRKTTMTIDQLYKNVVFDPVN